MLDKQSQADDGVRQSELEVSGGENSRLVALAGTKKRNRMTLFNSSDGVSLQLRVKGHEQRQQKVDQYCGKCWTNREGWRGRRTTFKCSLCYVHLCVRTYSGLRKSFWDIWHSSQVLEARRQGYRLQYPLLSRFERTWASSRNQSTKTDAVPARRP